jgi:hypothetical protein
MGISDSKQSENKFKESGGVPPSKLVFYILRVKKGMRWLLRSWM